MIDFVWSNSTAKVACRSLTRSLESLTKGMAYNSLQLSWSESTIHKVPIGSHLKGITGTLSGAEHIYKNKQTAPEL